MSSPGGANPQLVSEILPEALSFQAATPSKGGAVEPAPQSSPVLPPLSKTPAPVDAVCDTTPSAKNPAKWSSLCGYLLILLSVLVAIFMKDIERKTVKIFGVPATGAEDMSLATLRSRNRNVVDMGLITSLFNPMSAMVAIRYQYDNGFDNMMFGMNETASKSPFSWYKAFLSPGILTCQYASHFYDTDPITVGAMCTAWVADDILLWASIISLFVGGGITAWSKDSGTGDKSRFMDHMKASFSAELGAIAHFLIGLLAFAALGVSVGGFDYLLSLFLPEAVMTIIFSYVLILFIVVNIHIVCKVLRLTAINSVLDPFVKHIAAPYDFIIDHDMGAWADRK